MLRCLVGWLAQPFLQQKGELVLERFLVHKKSASCFKANLHNAGTEGKDVTHYGVRGGVCYFCQVLCSMDEGVRNSSEQL